MRSNSSSSNSPEPYKLASPTRRSVGTVGSMADNKENEDVYFPTKPRKMRQSPSSFSSKSSASMRRSPTLDRMPVISQPTLDDSSREKVRNKIKHSPSMSSINNSSGESESHSTQQKRLISDSSCYANSGRIERCFETPTPRNSSMRVSNSSHNHASEVSQSSRIHQSLASNPDSPGFVAFDDMHSSTMNDIDGVDDLDGNAESFCTSHRPEVGTSLEEFTFASRQEPSTVLIKVAQVSAQAEAEFEFEHRNSHAANIIVERSPSNGEVSHVTLINCDLARMVDPSTGQVFFTPLDRSEFYKPRSPILALMRARVKDPQQFYPSTNVSWLVYLVKYSYSRWPCSASKRAEDTSSPSWGGSRKAPRSAQEAFDRLVRKS